jgi:hypothetical protein
VFLPTTKHTKYTKKEKTPFVYFVCFVVVNEWMGAQRGRESIPGLQDVNPAGSFDMIVAVKENNV